jgi:hypothetical protein
MTDTTTSGLNKKVGPLPVGVWIVAIGGGLIIAYTVKSKSSGGSTLAVAANGTTGPDSGVGNGSVGGWAFQPPTATAGAKTYATNEEWGQAAIAYLIGQNYDASLADAAIRNYLGGLQVSVQQQPLVDAAIRGIGPTPQILNPISGPAPNTPITTGVPPVAGGGGGTNTPPPTNTGGLFGFLFRLADIFIPGISGSLSNINVPVNGQNYGVSGSYGSDKGSVTVTNPDGSTVTVNADPNSSTTSNATTTPVATITGTRSYTVVAGDTLSMISIKMYGSALQQDKIYNANAALIPDRDHLIAGTSLNIPE